MLVHVNINNINNIYINITTVMSVAISLEVTININIINIINIHMYWSVQHVGEEGGSRGEPPIMLLWLLSEGF